jgi:anti-sigma B factor antagonist
MPSDWKLGTVTVDHLGREQWVVDVVGEHDLSTVDDLREWLDAIFATGTSVVVDLSAASFIDASIVSELVRAQRHADRGEDEQLAVVVPAGGFVARMFEMLGLDVVMSVFESRADALQAFEDAARRRSDGDGDVPARGANTRAGTRG